MNPITWLKRKSRYISLRKNQGIALTNNGLKALKKGDIDQAILILQQAVQQRPDIKENHLYLGKALLQAGKFEVAHIAFRYALSIDPYFTEAKKCIDLLPSEPPVGEDFKIGNKLKSEDFPDDEYEIVDRFQGGFGIVYIADIGYSLVALKTLQSRFLWSEINHQNFYREAMIWMQLGQHPNIVKAIKIDTIRGISFIVLEYIYGGTLSELLRKKGRLSNQRAMIYGKQFCKGMVYANSKLGIVHGDIKASNCLLGSYRTIPNGLLKITDFGLSRVFTDINISNLGISNHDTMVNRLYAAPVGTLQYMAPEQFTSGTQLETRTDIYAFGIMLFQMLTNELPLSGRFAQKNILQISSSFKINPQIQNLILSCVEPEINKRPSSFSEILMYLESLGGVERTNNYQQKNSTENELEQMNNIGVGLHAIGKSKEAIKYFDECLLINPDYFSAILNKGSALISINEFEESLACLDRALEIKSSDRGAWKNKGLVLRKMGRIEEAINCYNKALQIDPDDSTLWLNKGVAFEELNNHEDALLSYNQGLKLNPNCFRLWCNKGIVLYRIERYRDSIVCFDKSIKLFPKDVITWRNKGLSLQEMGHYDKALLCFERAIEIDPNDFWVWSDKATCLEKMGHYDAADKAFDRYAELKIGNHD